MAVQYAELQSSRQFSRCPASARFGDAHHRAPRRRRAAHTDGRAPWRPCLHAQQVCLSRRAARRCRLPCEACGRSPSHRACQASRTHARAAQSGKSARSRHGGAPRDIRGDRPRVGAGRPARRRSHYFLERGSGRRAARISQACASSPARSRRPDARGGSIHASSSLDARHIGNLDRPLHPGSGELLETRWLTIPEALELALPDITRDILNRLAPHLAEGRELDPEAPVSFQYFRGKSWREDTL